MVGLASTITSAHDKQAVMTLHLMKQLMMGRFLYTDYQQHLYQLYHNYHRGNRIVSKYTYEFLRLAERNNLEETHGHKVYHRAEKSST